MAENNLFPVLFQYIVCFGSTYPFLYIFAYFSNFNTSYVSVLLIASVIGANISDDFNTSYVSVLLSVLYNSIFLARISIHRMFRFYLLAIRCNLLLLQYFNTSYVSVLLPLVNTSTSPCVAFQYIVCFGSTNPLQHISICFLLYFNTSYVSVLHKKKTYRKMACIISIHRMFRFYLSIAVVKASNPEFQYIVCFGSTNCL